jgi:hypothetical protein
MLSSHFGLVHNRVVSVSLIDLLLLSIFSRYLRRALLVKDVKRSSLLLVSIVFHPITVPLLLGLLLGLQQDRWRNVVFVLGVLGAVVIGEKGRNA